LTSPRDHRTRAEIATVFDLPLPDLLLGGNFLPLEEAAE
jgi:hypothetical protein